MNVSMLDLEPGSLWEFPTAKRVEIVDRPFIWGGLRWVVVDDHDFSADPRVFRVTRFEGARRLS